MRFLHTSDWHLGRTLLGRSRQAEFAAFLDWLVDTISQQQVEALLLAGDIFDTTTPPVWAQDLYFRFLDAVIHRTGCRHVVVTAGNHDPAALLEAPAPLLRALNVHVIGQKAEDPAGEVVVLRDDDGQPQAVVCAVPFLRDRDVRLAMAGESGGEKDSQLVIGILEHYRQVRAAAGSVMASLAAPVPLLAMGHLFAAGGTTVEGDGTRDLYVGSLTHVPAALLPADFDYLALGHLHSPQMVGGRCWYRYSGAPLAMTCGEAQPGRQKSLCLVETPEPGKPRAGEEGGEEGAPVRLTLLPVPSFQPMARLESSDADDLLARLEDCCAGWRLPLKAEREGQILRLELVCHDRRPLPDLRRQVEVRCEGCAVDVLRLQLTARRPAALLSGNGEGDSDQILQDLDPDDVFSCCLQQAGIAEDRRPPLLAAWGELLAGVVPGPGEAC